MGAARNKQRQKLARKPGWSLLFSLFEKEDTDLEGCLDLLLLWESENAIELNFWTFI